MKRDKDLIKLILTTIENDGVAKGESFSLPNVEYSILEGHLKLLEQERIINVDDKKGLSTGEKLYFDVSLTQKGYNFLEEL